MMQNDTRNPANGPSELPVKVLQFGEGNFMRAFADWMLHQCNKKGLFNGSVAVTQPRPSGKHNIETLKSQQGLYTVLVRGLREGQPFEEREVVSVFSRMIDPYEEWDAFLSLAGSTDLEFVISNTTEAGLTYQYTEWNPTAPVPSYPGKLTVFLYQRYMIFGGDSCRGLIHLPCELLDRNGDRLLDIVLRHADDWSLPDAFKQWVKQSNTFLNTLVDRIVTGYPQEDADGLFAAWGYADPLLTTAEPYYLWAIEASEDMETRLPFQAAGLNVRWVTDLSPYQLLKVRILNGAHTLMATLGLAYGFSHVREAIDDSTWGAVWKEALLDEIVPGLPLPRTLCDAYVNETLERFRNPYIHHRLTDIAMNSLSKWKTRLLPSLKAYMLSNGKMPPLIAQSLAALIWLYLPHQASAFVPKDDEKLIAAIRSVWEEEYVPSSGGHSLGIAIRNILSLTEVWGENLAELDGLVEAVVHFFSMQEAEEQ